MTKKRSVSGGTFRQVPKRRIRLSFVECAYPDLCHLLHNFRLPANGRKNSQHCCADNVGSCCARVGKGVQTDATLLANNSQRCWMLHVASVCTPCCMLLDVVACRCAKFETGQTFQPTTPNISFVPWSPKRNATMLDPFAQLFQHCWASHVHYAWFTKTYGLYPSHDVLQVPTLLGVVAFVCTPLPTRKQQLPTLLAQQCRELLRPFACSLKIKIKFRAFADQRHHQG